ncbi:MAG: formylglycine-generating enzyme family protein [Proteobacteria bacterium]|nr:formylglycine-generating enzyme family protein [Pseudomonadota bacterium]
MLVRRYQLAVVLLCILSSFSCATAPQKPGGKIQAAEPARPSEKSFTNSIGMKFVMIPAGTFMMGSPSNEPKRDSDERQHRVTISKPFYIQTTEVTQGQWREIMGNNPSDFKNCGDDCPVEKVSWNDCQEFIHKLNRQEGTNKYRLLTEAEWEYACRAGTDTPFYFGDCLSTDQANYDGNHSMPGCSRGEYRKRTVPVGSFPPNAWGLYDMHGNVWEWCQDWYRDYPSGHATDPIGPSSGEFRVLRGGSWFSYARRAQSANRYWGGPGGRFNRFGFRIAMTSVAMKIRPCPVRDECGTSNDYHNEETSLLKNSSRPFIFDK